MSEKALTREAKISTSEVTELGDKAVALIGKRSRAGYKTGFDPYGGLETHVAGFELESGTIIRVGTLQDWDGVHKRPDFHIVVTKPTEEEPRRNNSNRNWLNLKDGLEEAGLSSGLNFPYRRVHSGSMEPKFGRGAFDELSSLVAQCDPDNLIYLDSGERNEGETY